MSKKTKLILDTLNKNISINSNDELVGVSKTFGLILSDNRFVIAKETSRKTNYCTIYLLENFFSERLIKYEVVNNSDILKKSPWDSEDVFSIDDNLFAISFPIKKVLDRHIKGGQTTKKNLVETHKVINEYLKENPTFINELFTEKTETKHI